MRDSKDTTEAVAQEEVAVIDKQNDQPEQRMAEPLAESVVKPEEPVVEEEAVVAASKRRRKKVRVYTDEELSQIHHNSFYPILLALAIVVMLIGFISNPIVMAVGIIFIVAVVTGWILERR